MKSNLSVICHLHDNLYIGCENFPFHDTFSPGAGRVIKNSPDFYICVKRFYNFAYVHAKTKNHKRSRTPFGQQNSREYEENHILQWYVMGLQKFERLLKKDVRSGNVEITEMEIITDKTFDL